jgi:hypothetical protein
MKVAERLFDTVNTYSNFLTKEMEPYSALSYEKKENVWKHSLLRVFNETWAINAPQNFVKVDRSFRAERHETWKNQLEEARANRRKTADAIERVCMLQCNEPEVAKVPQHDLIVRAKRNSNHQVEFYLKAIYSGDDFNVICIGRDADNPAEVEVVEKELMKLVKDLLDKTVNIPNEFFMKHFFNELHKQKLSFVNGEDLSNVQEIYNSALEVYPEFAKAPEYMRIQILENAMKKVQRKNRDCYVLAKAIFEAIADADMIGILNISGTNYYKLHEYRRTRRHPDKHHEIWERNALIFVQYEYFVAGGNRLRASFHVSDLWLCLLKRSMLATA